ncbi:hypothetical protein FRX31_016712 [Thalictrum thalictroides]|uniref:Uncharacterized protein n=1 Tax=Thalictrum thalictroides TaxID=46969 RepID=A0A7J6WA07_THATH|nr:hypothetical protein FRX31_016712 [Thalictrum thalictroides]
MMMSESQMKNNEKTRDIKRKLAAIGGSVAVVAADITTLIAEFEVIQDVPANSDAKEGEKHDVDEVIKKDESPVDLSTQKKTRGERSSVLCDEARPMISELIQTVNCLADALKRNPDQDYADRLFAEVMKTEFFDEDFLVKAFDYLNQYPILARSFISKRPNMRREWLMRSASKWLENDYMPHSYFKFKPPSFGGSGGSIDCFQSFGASSAPHSSSNSGGALFGSGGQALGASTPFGFGQIKPPTE